MLVGGHDCHIGRVAHFASADALPAPVGPDALQRVKGPHPLSGGVPNSKKEEAR